MKKFFEDFNACVQNKKIKLSFFDRIISRTHKSKLINFCHYKCSILNNTNNIKIEGRYPFKELLCFTEFFSSLFSLFNLIVHLYYYNLKIKNLVKKSKIGYLYKYQHNIICSCWVASILFHMNETTLTRNLDYFLAFLFLLFAAFLSIKRLSMFFDITRGSMVLENSLKSLFVFYYVFHLYYMIFVDFNYRYSKTACGVLLSITIVAWISHYFMVRKMTYSKNIIIYIALVIFGALIEIRDYPPMFYLIDSHAAWHLITALIAPFYYKFIGNDIIYESTNKKFS